MIFIDNKYTTWYNSIIESAKKRKFNYGYFDVHHIIPKACGGNNDPNNLVKLTRKEHLLCHHLLVKMTINKQHESMLYAFNMMSHFKKYNGRMYEALRDEFSNLQRKRMSGKNHPMYGKKQKQSTIDKRLKNTKRMSRENHPLYGKKQKQSTIDKRLKNTDKNLLKSQLGKKGELHPSYGKPLSDQHKESISKTSKGHKKPKGFAVGESNSNYGKRRPGSRTGTQNAMFGKLGKNNPNYGSSRTDEQKYNIKVGVLKKNLDKYISVINSLSAGKQVNEIVLDTGVSLGVIREISTGSHFVHQYLKINVVTFKK